MTKTFATLIEFIRILTPRQRVRLWLLVFGTIVAALIDVVGVASVAPFLALVADPEAFARYPALIWLRDAFGIADTNDLLFVVGMIVLVIMAGNGLFNAVLTWAQLLFANLVGFTLSRRLLLRYLARDRMFFANRNSAELGKNILSEADRVVSGIALPFLILVSRAVAALAILIFLVLSEPWLALILAVVFGGAYFLTYLVARGRLMRLGRSNVAANEQRFKVVAECFGTLTELRLYGRVGSFAGRYDAPALSFARANANAMVISQIPRFLLDPLAFGSVVAIVLYALRDGNVGTVLPLVGLFAFAGYRMMPALQNIFTSISSLRFYLPAAHIVIDSVAEGESVLIAEQAGAARLPFARSIRLNNVSLAYDGNERKALDSIDLEIAANSTIGLVGRTGSGKSTLVGVMLGLLKPSAGEVLIDGEPLTAERMASWQRHVGFVPQDIYLIDDSVAANIALGVPEESVDMAAVERAARIAGIHDFIVGQVKDGYRGHVGERGSRISGGQRQRIGIARALYHEPDVIVFDEATSALDSETEQAVMQAISSLAGTRTIIMIAHRLTTLRGADQAHLLENGRLVASGPLEAISQRMGASAP